MLRTNTMHHLKVCLEKNSSKTKETRYEELTHEIVIDLHNERILDEDEYIDKMSISATLGGFGVILLLSIGSLIICLHQLQFGT